MDFHPGRNRSGVIWAAAVVLCVVAPGCWFHRGAPYPTQALASPIQVVLTPPSIRSDTAEFRALSLQATILMAEIVGEAPDLEAVPFWHTVPLALERLGASRRITPDLAASIANLSGARWATACELAPTGEGISILIDFMPANPTHIAFRYAGVAKATDLEPALTTAFEQFLRYLGVRPFPAKRVQTRLTPGTLITTAAAFDREYGWFIPAAPGQSGPAALDLERTDEELARILFDPTLYAARPVPGTPPATLATAPKAPAGAQAQIPASAGTEGMPAGKPLKALAEPPVAQTMVLPLITASRQKPFVFPDLRNPGKSAATPPVSHPVPGLAAGPPVAAPPDTPPAGKFEVQVFATRNRQAAEDEARRIQAAGFVAVIVPVDLEEKGFWYRVRLAGFATRASALTAGRKVVAVGLAEEFWVIRSEGL